MLGLIEPVNTHMFVAQAAGSLAHRQCLSRRAASHVNPVKPNTIANSIAIGNPADGYYALRVARQSGGGACAVTDEELIAGIKLLAQTEGIFAEAAGGAGHRRIEEAGGLGGNQAERTYRSLHHRRRAQDPGDSRRISSSLLLSSPTWNHLKRCSARQRFRAILQEFGLHQGNKEAKDGKATVMFTFPEKLIKEPIIYNLGRQFKVVTNIRRADVTENKGWVVLELEGEEKDIEQGIAWVTGRESGLTRSSAILWRDKI